MIKKRFIFLVVLFAFVCSVRIHALGAGELDPLFGTDSSGVFDGSGTVETDFDVGFDLVDGAESVVLQPDGKIIAIGTTGLTPFTFGVARYNNNGTLDNTFGTGGTVITGFGADSSGRDLALQPDGKIIGIGWTDAGATTRNWAIVRYNSDGSLDTTFNPGGAFGDVPNTAGIINLDIGAGPGFDQGSGVAVQPDGKIVVVGSADGGEAAVVRLNPNGTLDSTFNPGGLFGLAPNVAGILVINPGTVTVANGVTILADGSIVVVGHDDLGGDRDFFIFRLSPSGSLDPSFGTNGVGIFDASGTVNTDLGGAVDEADHVAVRSDGRLVVVGRSDVSGSAEFALVGYNSNGTLDTTFGTNGSGVFDGSGSVLTSFAGFETQASRVVFQSDGKIVVAGRLFSGGGNTNAGIAIARYHPNGVLDTTFSGDGKNTNVTGSGMRFGQVGLDLQSNDKAVVASLLSASSNSRFFLSRYTAIAVTDPVANSDSFTLCTDAQNVFLPVLTNDIPGSDLNLKVVSVTAPALGASASVANDGLGIVFNTPGGGVTGGVGFSYEIQDGNGISDTTSIVVSFNDIAGPNAVDDTFTICMDNETNHLYVVSNDIPGCDETLQIISFTQGTKGTVTQINPTVLNYAPNGTKGADSFTYTIEDGNGNTDTATVTITVV